MFFDVFFRFSFVEWRFWWYISRSDVAIIEEYWYTAVFVGFQRYRLVSTERLLVKWQIQHGAGIILNVTRFGGTCAKSAMLCGLWCKQHLSTCCAPWTVVKCMNHLLEVYHTPQAQSRKFIQSAFHSFHSSVPDCHHHGFLNLNRYHEAWMSRVRWPSTTWLPKTIGVLAQDTGKPKQWCDFMGWGGLFDRNG